jgi:hypothetical protein
MSMNQWTVFKDIATLLVGGLAALIAAFSYRRNSRTRRAEFLCQLHRSFFEDETYKSVRKALDTEEEEAIAAFVVTESEDFTDFLNFFELVAYLQRQNNLSLEDVEALLGYYLALLRERPALRGYIRTRTHGFEELDRLLAIMEHRTPRRS